jgi:hypothetical protein
MADIARQGSCYCFRLSMKRRRLALSPDDAHIGSPARVSSHYRNSGAA